MKFHLLRWSVLFSLLVFASCLKEDDPVDQLATSPSATQLSNEVVWEWTELYLSIERTFQDFRPGPGARVLGYVQMGAYETIIPGMPGKKSLTGTLQGWEAPALNFNKDRVQWQIALNAYYARVYNYFLYDMTPSQKQSIRFLEETQLATLRQGVPEGIIESSITWGQTVANAVLAYAESDLVALAQLREPHPDDYTPPTGDGVWKPSSPDQKALYPYWGNVRTFLTGNGDLVALRPYPYSVDPTSTYYAHHSEMAEEVSDMNDAKRWQAEFWSDDFAVVTFSPTARVFAIANQLVALKKMNLAETVDMYSRLGMAVNDVIVATWKSKYTYNVETPAEYIRQNIDPSFTTILGGAIGVTGLSPAYPSYPSEHSALAGVMWGVFERYLGAQVEFADHCHFGRTEFMGYPRTFSSFTQLAKDCSNSRIMMGVNVQMDCDEGLRLGKLVADNVLSFN